MSSLARSPLSRTHAGLVAPVKIVQIIMLAFAFLLPSLSWEQAAGAALLGLAFTWAVLPQIALPLRLHQREGSTSAGGSEAPGHRAILLYSVSVLSPVLIYRHHLEVAASAWAIAALGDSAAAMAGGAVRGPQLPWNPAKTWAGFVAFVLAGAMGSTILSRWVNPSLPPAKALIVSILAALLGAVVESAPIVLDDSLTVPLLCGGFIFCAFLVTRSSFQSNLPYLGVRLLLAAFVNLAFALVAFGLKTVSPSGAALGFVLGTMVYLGWGWKSFVILLSFFALGSLATRLGYATKAARGVAEHEGGARTWREALANVGPGAFFAILVLITREEHAFLVAFVAALAEAAGDTVSSEIGQWLSPRAYLITGFRPVSAGENGGVSVLGSIAGFAASVLIVILGCLLGLTGAAGAAIAFAAAVAGNVLDSLLGATLERRGLVTNGIVNFTGTAFAGALALTVTLR